MLNWLCCKILMKGKAQMSNQMIIIPNSVQFSSMVSGGVAVVPARSAPIR